MDIAASCPMGRIHLQQNDGKGNNDGQSILFVLHSDWL